MERCGERADLRHLAGRAARPRGDAAQGVRRDAEGSGLSGRLAKGRSRRDTDRGRKSPDHRYGSGSHSGRHRRQGKARDGTEEHRREAEMKKLPLSIATEDYDHFRDFRLGTVQAEGIEHIWLMPELHEIFARFTFNREWDVSELSFAKFSTQVTRQNPDIIALHLGAEFCK